MNFNRIFILLLLTAAACQSGRQGNSRVNPGKVPGGNDTVVVSATVGNELAGSSFRKRATAYFNVSERDTSDFCCVFSEAQEGEKVTLFLKVPYSRSKTSYRQRMEELKRILPVAAKEYNFDSLTSLGFGRLVQSGDLALRVTEEYIRKFGYKYNLRLKDYLPVADFLKESELGKDLDSLFRPYSLRVKKIVIEKLFFTSKEELLNSGVIESDPSAVTDKILDCITWVTLEKN